MYKHISLRFRKARRKFLHQIHPAFLFLKVIINLKHTWGGATAKFNTRKIYLEGATAKFNTRETWKVQTRNLIPAKHRNFAVFLNREI